MEERWPREFNTDQAKKTKKVSNLPNNLNKWMKEQIAQKQSGVRKEQVLLRTTKDRKLWRNVITHIMKRYAHL